MRSRTMVPMSKKERPWLEEGTGGASAGDVCVMERSDFGRRRLAFDAVRLRVRAAERRETWLGPSRADRRLRVDLTDRIDLASDTSTSLELLWEWTRVALEATAVAVTPTTTAMSVFIVTSPTVPVSSTSCFTCKAVRVPASHRCMLAAGSVSSSARSSRLSDPCSLSTTSCSSSSNSMAIFSASRHASSSSSSSV